MTGPTAHALFSASGAPGWMRCAPKLAAEVGLPDDSSEYADEGTAAHQLAGWCLEENQAALAFKGRRLEIINGVYWPGGDVPRPSKGIGQARDISRVFEVTTDMAGHVQNYVGRVHTRIEEFKLRGAVSVEMMVEVRVDYSARLGVPDSFGTSDVVLLIEWPGDIWQIDVGDLKFGMGVKVYASELIVQPDGSTLYFGNEQMMMYALGAYDQFAMLGDIQKISMAIYQPRVHHFDEYECDLATLLDFEKRARAAAEQALLFLDSPNTPPVMSDYSPGEKQCRWCGIKGTCKALSSHVINIVSGDFVDLDAVPETAPARAALIQNAVREGMDRVKADDAVHLDALWPNLELIDLWIKGVRGAIEQKALAGVAFTNCKVVQGKQGNRAWTDAEEAEKALKSFRLKQDEMYKFSLISPTDAEKVLKATPKRWAKVQALIGRAEGKLSVADISDKRPAVVVTPPADDFEDIGELA